MALPTPNQTTTPRSPWRHLLFLITLIIGIAHCTPASASVITDNDLNFSFTLPSGYIALPIPEKADGDMIYEFASSSPMDGQPDVTILIERAHGVIRLGSHIDPVAQKVPGGTVAPGKWKNFDIDILSAHIAKNNFACAVRIAEIPLRHEGIRVAIAVPIDQEDNADREMNKFLAGIDVPTTNLPTKHAFGSSLHGFRFGVSLLVLASFMLLVLIAGIFVVVRHSTP